VRIASVALLGIVGLLASEMDGADLPVRQVTLYKHGVAYYEREGSIPAGGEARLDFRAGDMNDVLKSLTVTDRSGNRITGIRYDSNESLDEKLSKYPFSVADQELLSTFLDGLKGAQVELKTDKTISGDCERSGGGERTRDGPEDGPGASDGAAGWGRIEQH
jgi:hypothetical protein